MTDLTFFILIATLIFGVGSLNSLRGAWKRQHYRDRWVTRVPLGLMMSPSIIALLIGTGLCLKAVNQAADQLANATESVPYATELAILSLILTLVSSALAFFGQEIFFKWLRRSA